MEKNSETLISHLEALRKTLIECFVALGVVLPFLFIFSPKLLNCFIKVLINNKGITFNYFSPVEVFLLQIKLAFVLDLAICFPYILKKIWDFLVPALYENEKKFIKSIVLSSSILFILGMAFCFFVILPLIINFGLNFSNAEIKPVFNISNIVNLSLWLMTAFGLMFQMPLVVRALIQFDILSYNSIASKRAYVVVILLIIAAILTPPDIISQIMLFIPTYLLFELGLLFSKRKNTDE